jgi:phosphatidate cytidylyltransferase
VDANLRLRIATATVGIPLLVWLVGWSPLWFLTGFFLILTIAALREYFALVFPGRRQDQIIGILFGLVLALLVLLRERQAPLSDLGAVLLLCFSAYLFIPGDLSVRMDRLRWTLLGGFYIGYLLPYWILLARRPDGRAWVSWVLLVIMIGDTTAYFVGRSFGKNKLAPAISPGKTVEGAYGYVAAGVIAGSLGARFLPDYIFWPEIIVVSVALTALGQVGDLFESWIKRVFLVKDAGSLLPGHGGLLDRLDSLIFPAVFMTTYLRYFHS